MSRRSSPTSFQLSAAPTSIRSVACTIAHAGHAHRPSVSSYCLADSRLAAPRVVLRDFADARDHRALPKPISSLHRTRAPLFATASCCRQGSLVARTAARDRLYPEWTELSVHVPRQTDRPRWKRLARASRRWSLRDETERVCEVPARSSRVERPLSMGGVSNLTNFPSPADEPPPSEPLFTVGLTPCRSMESPPSLNNPPIQMSLRHALSSPPVLEILLQPAGR